MNIEIGNKPIDFVFQGDELIYPNYVAKDNLVLHYDFSGRTNLDIKKGIAEDLSGNGNDGILENFAYESGSGYDSNSYLKFDNVDDFITIPELNLDVNNFTVAVDGEVLSYRGDNVAKINENGLEIGGRNLLLNTAFSDGIKHWGVVDGTGTVVGNELILSNISGRAFPRLYYSSYVQIVEGESYSISFEYKMSEEDNKQNMELWIAGFGGDSQIIPRQTLQYSTEWARFKLSFKAFIDSTVNTRIQFWINSIRSTDVNTRYVRNFKLEKGTIPTDWTPAPEDFQTTKITPIFSNKIKTLMYWDKALTDVELQEVYNVQKHRI